MDIINNRYDLDLPLARSEGIDSFNGAEIEIAFGDSQGSPSVGSSEVERLINKEKVVALVGCYQSAVTAEASRVADDKGLPSLVPESAATSLTQRGLSWLFRTAPDDNTIVHDFYEFLEDIQEKEGIEVEKLGIVNEDSLWGTEFAELVEQYARGYGYQVVESISYSSDATDVTSEVQRLKETHPDVVMQASYVNDAILADDGGFIEQEFLKTLGNDGDYILVGARWSKDLAEAKPLAGIINEMFRERYGTDMSGNSALSFTEILVLADAINRAGSTHPEAILEALLEADMPADCLVMPWDGIKFDQETHQNTLAKGIICQIIDEEYCTVWPCNLATKELIWPMAGWEERGTGS